MLGCTETCSIYLTYSIISNSFLLFVISKGTLGRLENAIETPALGVASGYAPGQIKICICLQAIPQAIYSTIFDLRGPRRRLRLCPRANKNLHMPSGYPPGNL
ncbi:hypothetical protein T12_12454 [Trichinella patagoniensis]|uniref:Uncharacterized protein n=1 Tax=Trichinella patagoniensis TaxID=990121 RepID=A0A0V1AD82_9BILA|nr:hypothetical protein T12_12454 [Trichinella patagoniensis]